MLQKVSEIKFLLCFAKFGFVEHHVLRNPAQLSLENC